jgi:hypothetical protein
MAATLPDSGLPAELDFLKNREATPARMNLAMTYIVSIMRQILALKPVYEAAINELVDFGLERLNLVLAPIFEDAQAKNVAITAIYQSWVAGNALDELHAAITPEVEAAVAVLADGRVTDLETHATAIDAALAKAAGERWFSNHGN